jgi:DNA-3-methyladenine glycosylase II
MRVYGLSELPDAREMEQIAEPWRPYRAIACQFLWRSLGASPV